MLVQEFGSTNTPNSIKFSQEFFMNYLAVDDYDKNCSLSMFTARIRIRKVTLYAGRDFFVYRRLVTSFHQGHKSLDILVTIIAGRKFAECQNECSQQTEQ